MQQIYQPTWDLDIIFSGGSDSEHFYSYMKHTEEAIKQLAAAVENFNPEERMIDGPLLSEIVEELEATTKQLSEVGAFISCLSAQNVKDKQANLLVSKRSELNALMGAVKTKFDQKLATITEDSWVELLRRPEFHEVSFVLNESRERAKEQLPEREEVLLNDLAIDGYQGWAQMYDELVSQMEVEIEEDGKVDHYSVGQAANKLTDPRRKVRRQAFEQLKKTWGEQTGLFAQTLNHLAGFRLQSYKHRGWKNVLSEPLAINRMKQETLDAMWTAVSNNKQPFADFLQQKAEKLGLEKLSMYDVNAPFGSTAKLSSYTEGAQFIIDQFYKFSPKMSAFAQMAFENRWIEAEDRADKRPGGFCTSFPDSEQTRIFMTYSGTSSNIATLAHELGHAYHQYAMNDVNGLNQRYPMNIAETASTFAEMIVADAAVKNAENPEEKKSLLANKIQRSITFFMNIHARFMFEQRFYEERKQGMVSPNRLDELMTEAQDEAYCGAVKDAEPHFWASKLHFHITDVPFYNFPYTFGYLFSLGIYDVAQSQKDGFEDNYIALLRDTGKMSVEDLAMKHLNIDLTEPDFWERAMRLSIRDVEEFMALQGDD